MKKLIFFTAIRNCGRRSRNIGQDWASVDQRRRRACWSAHVAGGVCSGSKTGRSHQQQQQHRQTHVLAGNLFYIQKNPLHTMCGFSHHFKVLTLIAKKGFCVFASFCNQACSKKWCENTKTRVVYNRPPTTFFQKFVWNLNTFV